MGGFRGVQTNKVSSEQGEPSSACGFYYLLTIKRCSIESTPGGWIFRQIDRLCRMEKQLEFSCYRAFELDKYNRLHYHTIVTSPNEVYYTRLQSKGWSIHFQEFPKGDYFTVVNYIRKSENAYDGDYMQVDMASHLYLSNDSWA